eukprot:6205692-Pleurochrysis_carterae.AAC.1
MRDGVGASFEFEHFKFSRSHTASVSRKFCSKVQSVTSLGLLLLAPKAEDYHIIVLPMIVIIYDDP